jgi:hypothetical protein
MRSYFPLTDFDFYAYVVSGLALLVAFDYACPVPNQLLHWDWTFVKAGVVVGVAYFTGQVAALLSTWLLEHWLLKRLKPPAAIMLGMEEPGKWDERVRSISGTRYLERLSPPVIAAAKMRAAEALRCSIGELDREAVFQFGFAAARCSEDACRRMDRDRREYEFSRNMAMVGMIAAPTITSGAIWMRDLSGAAWAFLAAVTSSIMFVRYVRYYASYHSQVIRAAALPHP